MSENKFRSKRHSTPFVPNYKWQYFFQYLRNNPKMKLFLAIATILAIGITATLFAVLFPLIVKLFETIGQSGIHETLSGSTFSV